MSHRWVSIDAPSGPARQILTPVGEWVDFRAAGDSTAVFLRVPGAVSLDAVAAQLSRFGVIRSLAAYGSPESDGTWTAVCGFFTATSAWRAQRSINAADPWALLPTPPPSAAVAAVSGVDGLDVHAGVGAGADGRAACAAQKLSRGSDRRARVGVKRTRQGDAVDAAAGAAPDDSEYLTSGQALAQLHALLPLQWSNTIESLEVSARCAPRRSTPAPAARTRPGGIPAVWDEGAGEWLPRARDVILRGGAATAAAEEAAATAAAAAGEVESVGGDGAGAAAAPVVARGSGLFKYDLDDDSDPELPMDASAVAFQVAKYDDFRSRDAAVVDANDFAAAHDASALVGFMCEPVVANCRDGVPILRRSLLAPAAKCPCVFVRQFVHIHNADGTVAISGSAGGCTCRHRSSGLTAAVMRRVGSAADGGDGGSGETWRPYLSRSTGHIADASHLVDDPLPLSQQATQESPPGAGRGAVAGARPRRFPRATLKSRRWTLADTLDGTPVKFVCAEAMRRACDRLRIFVPGALTD